MRFLLVVIAVVWSQGVLGDVKENHKVLLIGIDGLQFQYIQKLPILNINSLHIQQAYTGGIVNQQTQQATSSGPAWATIMTGVWANKHEVTSNDSSLANTQFPSLYRRIYEHNPSAIMYGFATWEQTHTRYFKNDLSLLAEESHGGTDEDSFEKTLAVLKEKSADFIFLHLDDVDHAGHAYCFGSEYEQAILKVDERVGELISAIESRLSLEKFKEENWLLMLVTDHGRDEQGCAHGSQTEQEKTVFIGSNKAFNAGMSEKVLSANRDFNGLYDYLPQTTVAPTILDYLGIDAKDEWLLEANSLFQESNMRALNEGASAHEFLWFVEQTNLDTKKMLSVWRNNKLVDKVPYSQGRWIDKNPVEKLNDYQFKLNGISIAYRVEELSFIDSMTKKLEEIKDKFFVLLEFIFSPFIRYFT